MFWITKSIPQKCFIHTYSIINVVLSLADIVTFNRQHGFLFLVHHITPRSNVETSNRGQIISVKYVLD
jgi:hypothetical protein